MVGVMVMVMKTVILTYILIDRSIKRVLYMYSIR